MFAAKQLHHPRLLVRAAADSSRLGQFVLSQTRRSFAREAPLPPLSNPVEQAIATAQQRGELNNLQGAGKRLQKNGSSVSHTLHSKSSSNNLLSSKAEFEIRRAIKNNELELEHLHGQAREYKGTSIVDMSLTGGSGGGSGGSDAPESSSAMGKYILKQAQPSVKDLKGM